MDFRDRVFISVAENLNFSRAADQLFISQPAVTRHIKELESAMGISLFERKGSRVYLTHAGEVLYNHLKKIAQQYSELDYAIGILKDEHKGVLRVGASSTISQYVIPPRLAAFHKRYPQIELSLLNGNSVEMEQRLLNNEIDLAMVENYTSHHDIRYTFFAEDRIVAIAGKDSPLARRESLTLQDLTQIPMVLREHGSGTLQVIEHALEEAGIEVEKLPVVLYLGSTEAIKNFLSGFDGLAFVSEKAIVNELINGSLVKIDIANFQIKRDFRIALRMGTDLKVPRMFINFLLDQ